MVCLEDIESQIDNCKTDSEQITDQEQTREIELFELWLLFESWDRQIQQQAEGQETDEGYC